MDNQCFLRMAKESYDGDKKIDDNIMCKDGRYDLILSTNTLKAYINNKLRKIILAVRGTYDLKDVLADIQIATNSIKYSSRYIKDKKEIDKIVNAYPKEIYNYYVVGHSLGGELSRLIMKDYPFVKSGVSFNGAVQVSDLFNQNKRLQNFYIDEDPLYKTGGRLLRKKKVFKYRPPNKTRRFFDFVRKMTPLKYIPNSNAHSLKQFDNRDLSGSGIYDVIKQLM